MGKERESHGGHPPWGELSSAPRGFLRSLACVQTSPISFVAREKGPLHAEKVPFPRAPKEIGDVCTQAIRSPAKRGSTEFEPRGNWVRFSERTFPASYTTVFLMYFEVKYRVVDGFSSRRNQQKK